MIPKQRDSRIRRLVLSRLCPSVSMYQLEKGGPSRDVNKTCVLCRISLCQKEEGKRKEWRGGVGDRVYGC